MKALLPGNVRVSAGAGLTGNVLSPRFHTGSIRRVADKLTGLGVAVSEEDEALWLNDDADEL